MHATLPGFRAFYPEDCALRNHLFRLWRQSARAYGFLEYDAPVLEPLELYIEKSGEEIVGQLFNFTDKGQRDVALRPEMTPSLARLVAAQANSLKRPIKWFSIGENYRYERQQKGRLRAFYQFNADILGESSPSADAECIALAVHTLQAFGLQPADVRVRLSDRDLWVLFLTETLGLSPEAAQATLGIIDKAERLPPEKLLNILGETLSKAGDTRDATSLLKAINAFRALNTLEAIEVELHKAGEAAATRLHEWRTLLGTLDAMGLGDYVKVDMGIVRGLAYYTGFVFEIFPADGKGRALAGGGRYDHLVRKLGGPDMPAVGFAMGDVTLGNLLEEKKLLPTYVQEIDLFIAATGEREHRCALADATTLRAQNFRVEYPLKPGQSLGRQLKTASQSGARFAAIYGEDELAKDGLMLRNLRTREEHFVLRAQLAAHLEA